MHLCAHVQSITCTCVCACVCMLSLLVSVCDCVCVSDFALHILLTFKSIQLFGNSSVQTEISNQFCILISIAQRQVLAGTWTCTYIHNHTIIVSHRYINFAFKLMTLVKDYVRAQSRISLIYRELPNSLTSEATCAQYSYRGGWSRILIRAHFP